MCNYTRRNTTKNLKSIDSNNTNYNNNNNNNNNNVSQRILKMVLNVPTIYGVDILCLFAGDRQLKRVEFFLV